MMSWSQRTNMHLRGQYENYDNKMRIIVEHPIVNIDFGNLNHANTGRQHEIMTAVGNMKS